MEVSTPESTVQIGTSLSILYPTLSAMSVHFLVRTYMKAFNITQLIVCTQPSNATSRLYLAQSWGSFSNSVGREHSQRLVVVVVYCLRLSCKHMSHSMCPSTDSNCDRIFDGYSPGMFYCPIALGGCCTGGESFFVQPWTGRLRVFIHK